MNVYTPIERIRQHDMCLLNNSDINSLFLRNRNKKKVKSTI